MSIAYFQVGVIESLAGLFVYYVIMAESGFFPKRLFGLRVDWEKKAINDLPDSYGQEWTSAQRKVVEATCYTGFLLGSVMTQVANVITMKTRRASIVEQGMK